MKVPRSMWSTFILKSVWKFMKLLELKGPIAWNWVVPHVKFVKKTDEIFWKVREIGSIFLSIWMEESWISLETFWNSVGILCEMILPRRIWRNHPLGDYFQLRVPNFVVHTSIEGIRNGIKTPLFSKSQKISSNF